MIASSKIKKKLFITVVGPDGKPHQLGRVDNKYWAPRAWFYRFVTFPLLKRKHNKKEKS